MITEFSIDKELLASEVSKLKKSQSFRSSIVNEEIPIRIGGFFGFVNLSRVSNSGEITYLVELKLDNGDGFCGSCLAEIMKYQRTEEKGLVNSFGKTKEIPMFVSLASSAWWGSSQEKNCPLCVIEQGEDFVSLQLPAFLQILLNARIFRDDFENVKKIKTFEDADLFENFIKNYLENRLVVLLKEAVVKLKSMKETDS